MPLFQDINFPPTQSYSSDTDHQPLEFYEEAFPKSVCVDMVLGYFSTNAIRTLSMSFAEFIYGNGSMRIVTNHFLSEQDKQHLLVDTELEDEDRVLDIFSDISRLRDELGPSGQHFFDCLKYLLAKDRLQILPVMHKPDALAHYKKMILFDGTDRLFLSGSANFTQAGMIRNGESFLVDRSWVDGIESIRLNAEMQNFEKIFCKEHKSFEYLDHERVIAVITEIGADSSLAELIEASLKLQEISQVSPKIKAIFKRREEEFEYKIERLKADPKFPYPNGPREYQQQAYQNWVDNGYQGMFAMATGTGKTITSLNCILQEYLKTGFYNFVVLVPTIALAGQWFKELHDPKGFNFREAFICSSQHKNWEESMSAIGNNLTFGNAINFCVIATYASFRGKRFQELWQRNLSKGFDQITLIADEAHTLGSAELLKVLPWAIHKRIGLSATPERPYDETGEVELGRFFNAQAPSYTFVYNMKKAIDDKVLCKYFYYPRFVELENEELAVYRKFTRELAKHIDPATGRYRDSVQANNLLIQRKNVIHKAANKEHCLNKIIELIGSEKFKYAFIYVPEGNRADYSEDDTIEVDLNDERIINRYTTMPYNRYRFKMRKFLGNTPDRENILEQFAAGELDAILAMKCLDEGVDIPRTQYAIFCSSTGNPRQYVQRRGRVLRQIKGKEFAYIYDMVVRTPIDVHGIDLFAQKAEKNILMGELRRLINFAALAENKMAIMKSLEDLASYYRIDIYEMMNTELDQYNI